MARYFFDIENGGLIHDDEGVECDDDAMVREAVVKALPAIAADELRSNGDHRYFNVIVRDDTGQTVYAAVLSYNGVWLRTGTGSA